MKTSTIDTLGSTSATTSATAGSITALFSFMSHDVLFGIAGIFFTLMTFVMSWHYKRKSDLRAETIFRRREAERELRMEIMRKQGRLLMEMESMPASEEDAIEREQ